MKSGAGRVWLAAAVGVLVVIGGIVLIGRNNGNTEDAAAPPATTAPESPGATLPTTTVPSPPPTAPPTTEPTVDADSLPAAGFGIREEDGTVTLFDLDGALLGTVETADVPPIARQLSIGLGKPPQLAATVPVAAEAPPGCDSATADGGVHLALCGEELQQRRQRRALDVDLGQPGIRRETHVQVHARERSAVGVGHLDVWEPTHELVLGRAEEHLR